MAARGAFFVIEGMPKSGRTTQAAAVADALRAKGLAVAEMRFPDPDTAVGRIVKEYADGEARNAHALHLLAAAELWDAEQRIVGLLKAGTTVVCDGYVASLLYPSPKTVVCDGHVASVLRPPAPGALDAAWCSASVVGLPKPDLVVYLDRPCSDTPDDAAPQGRVTMEYRGLRCRFGGSAESDPANWYWCDASESRENVTAELMAVLGATVALLG